jgi:hypothetical protein
MPGQARLLWFSLPDMQTKTKLKNTADRTFKEEIQGKETDEKQ